MFLPSGTMCNEIALRLHIRPGGDELIARPDRAPGQLRGRRPGRAGRRDGPHRSTATAASSPPTSCAPRSGRRAAATCRARGWSGSSRPPTSAAAGCGRSRRSARCSTSPASSGLRAHLDGARLMNAVVASGIPAARVCRAGSTPRGSTSPRASARRSAPCSPARRELIAEAWRYKQMMGGAFRQSGIVAAGCLYALDHHVDRLAEDHEHARMLADGLAAASGRSARPATRSRRTS